MVAASVPDDKIKRAALLLKVSFTLDNRHLPIVVLKYKRRLSIP